MKLSNQSTISLKNMRRKTLKKKRHSEKRLKNSTLLKEKLHQQRRQLLPRAQLQRQHQLRRLLLLPPQLGRLIQPKLKKRTPTAKKAQHQTLSMIRLDSV